MAGRVKNEPAARIVVERLKEWNPLDVVPVKMRNKDVRFAFSVPNVCAQEFPQGAQSSPAVKNEQTVADAHLDTGGVSAVTQVIRLGRGSRSTHTPEFDLHGAPEAKSGVSQSSAAPAGASMLFPWQVPPSASLTKPGSHPQFFGLAVERLASYKPAGSPSRG